MKRHYWQFLINSDGTPISGARIHVFKSDAVSKSTIEASAESGGILTDISLNAYAYVGDTYSKTVPNYDTTDNLNIQSGTDGYFEFWVSDKGEEEGLAKGYETDQLFTIAIVKDGFDTLAIDYINLFPISYEVEETDTSSTIKNKLVSNRMISLLVSHRTSDWTSNPHDIESADLGATSGESDWDSRNKLISNHDFFNYNEAYSTSMEVATDVNWLSAQIDNNESAITDNENDIVSIQAQVDSLDTLNSDVNWLSAQVDNNESNISSNSGEISIVDGKVDAINVRVTDLETDVDWMSGQVNDLLDLESNVSTVESLANINNSLISINIDDISDINNTLDAQENEKSFSPDLSANDYSGVTGTELVVDDVTVHDLLSYSQTLSGYVLAKADSWENMPVEAMALETKNAYNRCLMLYWGLVENSSWSWELSASGKMLYASPSISGDIDQVAPTGVGELKQIIGTVRKTDVIKFNPQLNIDEIT